MNFAPYIPYVLKAIVGGDVKESMDNNPDVIDRPFWLSGRFIGGAMTAVFGTFAAKIGMDLNASITNMTDLTNLVYDNWELMGVVVAMFAGIARGLWGLVQAMIRK